MASTKWADFKSEMLTPERAERIRKEVEMLSREIRLQELRVMLKKTQVELATSLGKSQESLSKLENRKDFRLSTAAEYAEALGGHLRLFVEVDGMMIPLELPAVSRPVKKKQDRRCKVAVRG